jgi:hypothetical protein
MKTIALITVFAGMTVIFGCNNEATEMPDDDDNPGQGDCTPQFPDMNVTYNNYVKGVLTKYCIECHHAGNSTGPGDFNSYNGIMVYAKGNSFQARVIQDNADMPQGNAPLPKAIRDSLDVWISNCAPQN